MLKVRNLEAGYGPLKVLKQVSLHVSAGEIVTLIGANGAGKTTTLRAISGLLKPREGDIVYRGESIRGLKTHVITKMGISHVPEGRGIFSNLTVHDNLELGAYLRKGKIPASEYDHIFGYFPVLKDSRDL